MQINENVDITLYQSWVKNGSIVYFYILNNVFDDNSLGFVVKNIGFSFYGPSYTVVTKGIYIFGIGKCNNFKEKGKEVVIKMIDQIWFNRGKIQYNLP